jgi:hypothetical protein
MKLKTSFFILFVFPRRVREFNFHLVRPSCSLQRIPHCSVSVNLALCVPEAFIAVFK